MKEFISHSQRVGITESGEPAFNLDLFKGLYEANVIITKSLTDKLIEKLVENKSKIILHITCTGYGGTEIEPFVPSPEKTRTQTLKLIEKGFPAEQIVLRIDPCFPTIEGQKRAYYIAALFAGTGIKRLRFSVLDMYDHVKERFKKAGCQIPYSSFHASSYSRNNLYRGLQEISKKYGYEIETCAEPGIKSISCISQKDIEILNLSDKITLKSSAKQRKTCGCPANKTELIHHNKAPRRCQNQCLYCFWKDR